MARSSDAANWQERVVALALVAGVGLATQFVVERTLPTARADQAATPISASALQAAAWEAPGTTLPVPLPLASGLQADSQPVGSGTLSSLTSEEVSGDRGPSLDEVGRARRVRTRSRRFLPQRAEAAGERPAPAVPRVALGTPPVGWTDLTAPLRAAGEPSIELPAILVPTAISRVATAPTALAPIQPLLLPLEIPEELEAEVLEGGQVLILRDRGGNVVEERGAPTARDGDGRPLPARYEEEDGEPRLRLDPREALPPIQVRPGEPELPRSKTQPSS